MVVLLMPVLLHDFFTFLKGKIKLETALVSRNSQSTGHMAAEQIEYCGS